MKYLSIKNFDQYQHYKDRRPPWIKLHVAILDDYDFGQLSDASKAHIMLLWALASKFDNKIPYDLAWITQRIAASDPVDIDELIIRGFLEPHDEKRASGKRENWASRYVSAQTRSAIFSAGNHACAACGSAEKLEIDHIIPISKGGTGNPDNLQVLCRQCNRRKRTLIAEQGTGVVRSDLLRRSPASGEPETEAEKRQKKTKTSDSGESGLGVVQGSAAKPQPKYPAFPNSASVRIAAAFSKLGFGVDVSMIRKTLNTFFPASGAIYTVEQIEAAAQAFVETRDSQDSPKEQGFFTIQKFSRELGTWVRLGAMPRQDPETGAPTERGLRLAGAA